MLKIVPPLFTYEMHYASEMKRAMWKYFCESVDHHGYNMLLSRHTVA